MENPGLKRNNFLQVTHRRTAGIMANPQTLDGGGSVPAEPETMQENVETPPPLTGGVSAPAVSADNGLPPLDVNPKRAAAPVAPTNPLAPHLNTMPATPALDPTAEANKAAEQRRITQQQQVGGGASENPAYDRAQQAITQKVQTRMAHPLHQGAYDDRRRQFLYDIDGGPDYHTNDMPPSAYGATDQSMFQIKEPVDDYGRLRMEEPHEHPSWQGCQNCLNTNEQGDLYGPDDDLHQKYSDEYEHEYKPIEDLPAGVRLAAAPSDDDDYWNGSDYASAGECPFCGESDMDGVPGHSHCYNCGHTETAQQDLGPLKTRDFSVWDQETPYGDHLKPGMEEAYPGSGKQILEDVKRGPGNVPPVGIQSLNALAHHDPHQDMTDVLAIQKSHGNWDYSEYMHGMFNGMELMDSIDKRRDPKFREAPDHYGFEKAEAKTAARHPLFAEATTDEPDDEFWARQPDVVHMRGSTPDAAGQMYEDDEDHEADPHTHPDSWSDTDWDDLVPENMSLRDHAHLIRSPGMSWDESWRYPKYTVTHHREIRDSDGQKAYAQEGHVIQHNTGNHGPVLPSADDPEPHVMHYPWSHTYYPAGQSDDEGLTKGYNTADQAVRASQQLGLWGARHPNSQDVLNGYRYVGNEMPYDPGVELPHEAAMKANRPT